MQYRPTAAELLRDISALLSDEVLDQVSVEVQHKVRVAANIAQILEREVALAEAAQERTERDEAAARRVAQLRRRLIVAVVARITLIPERFSLVLFDADRLGTIAAEVADAIGALRLVMAILDAAGEPMAPAEIWAALGRRTQYAPLNIGTPSPPKVANIPATSTISSSSIMRVIPRGL